MTKILVSTSTQALFFFLFFIPFKVTLSEPSQTDELIVTSTRLTPTQTGASVTIIDSITIATSPAEDLPNLLGIEAGVHNRDLFAGTNGAEATVDMRGFGAVGTQNTLILLDGRRLNDLDLAAVDFANIPLNSIKHIEIIRGHAGSVLYGDGAVGGAINIVTKSPAFQEDVVEINHSFSHPGQTHNINMSAIQSKGPFSVNLATSLVHGEGFRDNNNLIQKNLIGQLRYTDDHKEAFVKLAGDFQSVGLPGARQINREAGTNEFTASPEQAASLVDKALQSGLRLDIGLTGKLPNESSYVIDGGLRTKDQDSRVTTIVDTVLTTVSFTPRADITWELGNHSHSSKIGIDIYHANYDSDRKQNPGDTQVHRYNAYQTTLGVYMQDEFRISDSLTIAGGVRSTWIGFTAGDEVNNNAPGGGFETDHDSTNQTEQKYVYNFGAEYQISPPLTVFARSGRAIRLPTIDERISSSNTNTFRLKTQTSYDFESGLSYSINKYYLEFSGFLMKLNNELRFNPTLDGGFGLNENTDPTKRIGAELKATFIPFQSTTLSANSSFIKATFREGVFSGNSVPLVPQWQFGANISWQVVPTHLAIKLAAHYVDQARLENDESNEGEQIPAYYLIDLRVGGQLPSTRFGTPNWSLDISNLLNHSYYNYGVRSTTNTRVANVYPLSGRVLRFMLAYQF